MGSEVSSFLMFGGDNNVAKCAPPPIHIFEMLAEECVTEGDNEASTHSLGKRIISIGKSDIPMGTWTVYLAKGSSFLKAS